MTLSNIALEKQQALRNAYTLGAPSGDREARARAMSAQAIYNDLERNGASKEELDAARQEYQGWAKWAAMPRSSRESVLQRGRKQAEQETGKQNFAAQMNELGGVNELGVANNKGAAELLRRASVANSGGPRIGEETMTDGRVTSRQVTGRYGSGSMVDTGKRGAGDANLRAQTEQLLLDQAARAGTAPGSAEDILTAYRKAITPQAQVAAAPAMQASQFAPVTPSPLMGQFAYQPDAYSLLSQPAQAPMQSQAPPAQTFASPVPVQPVATTPASVNQQDHGIDPRGSVARDQLGQLVTMASPLLSGLNATKMVAEKLPSTLADQEDRDLFRSILGAMSPFINGLNMPWDATRNLLRR